MLYGFQPGQILQDKYRIERVLGAGGMGVVVAARHLALDELVAIKFMLGRAKPADVTRFVREARAVVRLKSQHVARVLDVSALDDGMPYMVLEHLEGCDLAFAVGERGVLPVQEAADAILQACEAIAEAHSLGIIHRDIKPANLFRTRSADGSVCIKVLDFGIAKWEGAGTAKLEPSRPMGSAPYMAPEQFATTNLVDPRADVWALGATLFHLVTAKMPFHHDDVNSIQSMMHAVLHRPPLQPRVLRPELPEAFEAIMLRCLAKERAERFGNVAALAAALVPFGSEHAHLHAMRVARVLGVAEPHVPKPETSLQTPPLPEVVAIPTIPPTTNVISNAPAVLPNVIPPSKNRRSFAVVLILAVALGGILIGMLLGRESTMPAAAREIVDEKLPAPIAREFDVAGPLPREQVTASGSVLPAAVMTAAATTHRGIVPPRGHPTSLPANPRPTSTNSAPKDDPYGRRR